MKKLGFIIGRFQPLHPGHKSIIRQAAKQVDRLVIFIGSANVARSIKNPWIFAERNAKMQQFLQHEGIDNSSIRPLNDYKYNDSAWQREVIGEIDDCAVEFGVDFKNNNICMFGFNKEGNDYFDLFNNLGFEFVNLKSDSDFDICATDIRTKWFESKDSEIPPSVQKDYDYFKAEAGKFKDYPYPETLNFNCSDAIIRYNDKILLIERKGSPGIGNLALPGGFKNSNETFFECCIREVQEETGIILTQHDLLRKKMFDSPNRGFGIPRNTMVHYFVLEEEPEIEAGDDASNVEFLDLEEVMKCTRMHDDHLGILQDMLGYKMCIPASRNPRLCA